MVPGARKAWPEPSREEKGLRTDRQMVTGQGCPSSANQVSSDALFPGCEHWKHHNSEPGEFPGVALIESTLGLGAPPK